MRGNPDKPSITDPQRVITLSNGLSVLRAFLALPIVYFLSLDSTAPVVGLILLAIATDIFDGFFARRAHQITNVGKILDPTADAIALLSVVLFMTMDQTRQFPLWFMIVYMVRYLSISLSGVYIMNHYSVVLSSTLLGKLTVLISTAAVFLYVIRVEAVGFYLLLVATAIAIVSWIQYVLLHLSLLRQ